MTANAIPTEATNTRFAGKGSGFGVGSGVGEGEGVVDEIGMTGSEILNGAVRGYLSTASTM